MRHISNVEVRLDLLKELQSAKRISKKVNKRWINYLDVSASFDIETTSTYMNEEKFAFMYIWMFQLNNVQVYGRTWEEFEDLKTVLSSVVNGGNILPLYVHNLGFEFQFIKDYFIWDNVFANNMRNPLRALSFDGWEFRDSYILSGMNLENTAKNLMNPLKKLKGNLDYKKIRHYKTELTQEEMDYCAEDVNIVVALINEHRTEFGDVTKIPMTRTGKVRNYVRNECYYDNKNHKKSSARKFINYRNLMKELTLHLEEYRALKKAFQGGFTHANHRYSGKILRNVASYDFTSSYPAVMCSEKFPMSSAEVALTNEGELVNGEHIIKNSTTTAFLFKIIMTNVKPIFHNDHYISSSKTRNLKGQIIDNGRVVSADSLEMIITEVDYKIIKSTYSFDEEIVWALKFNKGYLPKPVIKSILDLYQAKTELKGVKGQEVVYNSAKEKINGIYGMTVTDIVKDIMSYDSYEGWVTEVKDAEEVIDKYNNSRSRFLFYPWGVWVTAYARFNLWTAIIECGDDYVYSDTDSDKILNADKHQEYFKRYDKMIIRKLERMCDYHKFNHDLIKPKTVKGEEKPLGVWDFEGNYAYFKTLGAKRYITVKDSGVVEITVAGLSKKNGLEYMLEITNISYTKKYYNPNNPEDGYDIVMDDLEDAPRLLEFFDDEMVIPANRTGKMTHTYIDKTQQGYVTDYKGNEEYVISHSGTHLEDTSFRLSMSEEYINYLTQQSLVNMINNGAKLIGAVA